LALAVSVGSVASFAVTGCSGGSSAAGGEPSAAASRPAPDLRAFLRLPVATPSSCPPDTNGTTSGRRSPWVGTVDISVFLAEGGSRQRVAALGRTLRALPHVQRVYFESKQQAIAEFERLYTCSAQVPASAVPASYRLVLDDVTRGERDALVRRIAELPGVHNVSCDPSAPCVGVT
jgi:hypothetical protein